MRKFILILFLWLGCCCWALAQDSLELSNNPPVAIVTLSQGVVEISAPGLGWRPAYWLTLVHPEDRIRTGDSGKVVLTYFYDYHRESIPAQSSVNVGFRTLAGLSGSRPRRESPEDRGVTEIPIPYLLIRPLSQKEFEGADAAGEFERENDFLSSYVKAEAFPPVFVWSDTGSKRYKLQLFNEWDEFLYETEVTEPRHKFPYQGNFQLAKNSLYKWQVTDDQNRIVVRKYPFVLLTTLHARELERSEKNYEQKRRQGKQTQADETDLFLLYVQRKMIDKYLHQLEKMAKLDPANPMIQRGLVRAYLAKGAPSHAWNSLQSELRLGGEDPVRP